MGSIDLSDIAKWDASAIGEVARTCQQLAVAVDDAVDPLKRMPIPDSWEGTAASSARVAMRQHLLTADRYIAATKVLGGAATIAQGPVQAITRSLVDLHMAASSAGLTIHNEDNSVEVTLPLDYYSSEEQEALKKKVEQFEHLIAALIKEANRVDDELAQALSKISDDGKESIWKTVANDLSSSVAGTLAGAKVDMLAKYGAGALHGVDNSLLPWLDEIKVLKTSPVGVAGNVLLMIPSMISDVGNGDKVWVAVTKEGGSAAAGIAGAAATGFVMGSWFPGVGNLAGGVIGAGVGALSAWGASKGLGALFD